jgi:hypothetical protein
MTTGVFHLRSELSIFIFGVAVFFHGLRCLNMEADVLSTDVAVLDVGGSAATTEERLSEHGRTSGGLL